MQPLDLDSNLVVCMQVQNTHLRYRAKPLVSTTRYGGHGASLEGEGIEGLYSDYIVRRVTSFSHL